MIDPLWRAAPTVLVRFRGLLLGQVLASALLVLAVLTGPMFLSAIGNAAINSSIAATDRFTSGFSLSVGNEFERTVRNRRIGLDYQRLDRGLDRATSGLSHLGHRVSTIISTATTATADGSDSEYPVRMIARTGAVDHVAPIAKATVVTDGLWIPDVVANELDVGPSDELSLTSSGHRVRVPVAGIYKNLINTNLNPFWSPLEQQINPLNPVAPPPPPLIIGTRPLVTGLAHRLHQRSAFFQWDYPIATRTDVTLHDANLLSRGLTDLENNLSTPSTPLGRSLACPFCIHYGFPNIAFGLQTAIDAAHAQVDSLREPVTAVTSAAALVALVTIGAACGYAASRRSAEFRLLSVRGWSPAKVAAKSSVESMLPVVLGTPIGYVAARAVLLAIGPGGAVTASPYLLVAFTMPAALLVCFATTAALVSRTTVTRSTSAKRSPIMWEVAPLAAGAGLFYWLQSAAGRFSAHGNTLRDVALLLGVP
ncbi:MAG: hypothetical protein M3290_03660, partial [Actinomycetota bacterium]|nr:hypothetical protein [Actinomycetota bacterium]